jgi:hypothetical protein
VATEPGGLPTGECSLMTLLPGRTTRLELHGTDLTPYVARRADAPGSYGWAKEHAAAAAELEAKLMGLAALTGKPLEVVRDQVAELAKAARCAPGIIISQLEYNHHYRMLQST